MKEIQLWCITRSVLNTTLPSRFLNYKNNEIQSVIHKTAYNIYTNILRSFICVYVGGNLMESGGTADSNKVYWYNYFTE